MINHKNIVDKIFSINSDREFEEIALDIFNFQYKSNKVYREYVNIIGKKQTNINNIREIPFLPISIYKIRDVICGSFKYDIVFRSSGTTSYNRSRHYVKDLKIYNKSIILGFNSFWGDINNYHIIGYLPDILNREDSSLSYMVKYMVDYNKQDINESLYTDKSKCIETVMNLLEKNEKKVIIIGVAYSLLSFAEYFSNVEKKVNTENLIIVETGGMKGHFKELIREELHNKLKYLFRVNEIYSEYGMAELLSQSYAKGNMFNSPPWKKILLRTFDDPFCIIDAYERTGGVNIIDLANIYSCSFIATDDIGKIYNNGCFEIIGRYDNVEIRGCNIYAV